MENSQQINWLLEIGKIAIPTLVALIVPFVTYRWITRKMADYQTILSKDIEDYKKDISKELENHKFQLQSDFQTKFYEFQTRYSLIHQKKAEAIEKLFELLAKVQNDIQVWMLWETLSRIETKEEFLLKTKIDFRNLTNFFDEKRIYFDDDIKEEVLKFVCAASGIIPRYDQFHIAEFVREINARDVSKGIYGTMEKLEKRFKQLLSAENPNNQLEKKQ